MAATQVESFCERCGTKYTFDQRAERGRRLRGLGRTLGFLAEDSVLDDVPLASRDPFHGTFRFCLECRQYTCPSCWNETAGFCQGCAPLAHGADMTDAEAFAAVEAASDLRDAMSEVNLLRSAEAWPGIDLPPVSLMEPVSNGSEPHLAEKVPFESNGFDGMPFAPVSVSSNELFAGPWDALAVADEAADDEAEGDWSVVAAPEHFVEPVAEIEADEDLAVAEEAETAEPAEPLVAALGEDAEPELQLELEGEVDTGAEYDAELELVAEADADAELDVAAEAVADAEPEFVAEAVTDAQSEFVAEGEPELDFDAEGEPELDFDAEGEPEPEYVAETEPTAEVEFDAETAPAPEPEPLPTAAAAALEPELEAEPAPAPPISAPRPVPSLLRPITELPMSPRPAVVTPPPATLPSSPTWMVPPTGAVSAPPTPPAATANPFVPRATPPMPPTPPLPPAPSLFAQPTQPSMTPSAVPASRFAALFGRGHKPEPPPPPMPAPGALPSGWRITAEDTSPQYQSAAFLPQPQTSAPQAQPPRPTLLVQPGHAHATPGIRPCFQCSLPLSSTARFCRRCGTPQQPTA